MPSRLYVFVQGVDGHLYLNMWNGGAWVWADQGIPASGVTVLGGVGTLYFGDNITTNFGGSRLYAYFTGGDGHLYFDFWNGGAWVWVDQGQPGSGLPVYIGVGTIYFGDDNVSINTGSRLHAFVTGSDRNHDMYDNNWNGTQWGWGDLGLIP